MVSFFDPQFLISMSLIAAVLTMVGVQIWMRVVGPCVAEAAWWPNARKLQKAMQLNMGKREDQCDERALLDSYTWVLFVCLHHAIAGCVMLPVVIRGWNEAGLLGQQLFAVGGILCIGFDAEDLVTSALLWASPTTFSCLGGEVGLNALIMSLFHHALSMSMFLPVLIVYPDQRPFHFISCSLLMAAGIAYAFGSYKFTLDTSEPCNFRKYKVVVLVQFITIWYTRAWLWFTSAYQLLRHFYFDENNENNMIFFVGGCVVIFTMSLFNLVMLADCTTAAIKWLPRNPPTSKEDKAALANTVAQSLAAQRGQTFGNGEQVAADLGLPAPRRASQRASLKMIQEELTKEEGRKSGEIES